MKKIINILLGFVTAFVIYLLAFIISLALFLEVGNNMIVVFGAFSCFGIAFLLKKRSYFAVSLVISSILLFCVRLIVVELNNEYVQKKLNRFSDLQRFIIEDHNEKKRKKTKWLTASKEFTIKFGVSNLGHIFLKGVVEGDSGIFLFDTGSDISLIHEKYTFSKLNGSSYSLQDADSIQQTKQLVSLNTLILGDIQFSGLDIFPQDSGTWENTKGIFYNNDSILGVIGGDIISRYIWDFNLSKKQVTISRAQDYCDGFIEINKVKLEKENNHWKIPVKINDIEKSLLLDFGCSSPIVISDSVDDLNKFKVKNLTASDESKGAFNHLNTIQNKSKSKICLVDFKLGAHKFNRIACIENDKNDLLGVPFIWSFDRVILDFKNQYIYFFQRIDSISSYSARKKSDDFISSFIAAAIFMENGKCEVYYRNAWPSPIDRINVNGDTIKSQYNLYANFNYYGRSTNGHKNNCTIDSIICFDSVTLPNNKMIYGNYTINMNEKYFIDSKNN